jgi:hypothetical protein
VPADGGTLVPRVFSVSQQQGQLERLRESDELELTGGRERFRDVAAIEGSAETHEGGALGGHEQMFA